MYGSGCGWPAECVSQATGAGRYLHIYGTCVEALSQVLLILSQLPRLTRVNELPRLTRVNELPRLTRVNELPRLTRVNELPLQVPRYDERTDQECKDGNMTILTSFTC